MTLLRRIGALIAPALLAASQHCVAQSDRCDPKTFAPAYFRILEDCGGRAALRANSPQRSGLQALRYLPLDADDPLAFASLGGEARLRWERLDPQRFGLAGGHPFTARGERLLLHADLHRDAWRAFVQLGAAGEVNWPAARAADKSEPDVAQAFIDWQFDGKMGAASARRLRLGRFELPFPTNRMVGVNDAANLRRTFQGAMLDIGIARTPLTAFVARPIVNKTGDFDDHWARTERFSGLDAVLLQSSGGAAALDSIDAFVFDRYRAWGQVQNAAGAEHVQTWGTRWAAHVGGLHGAVQATLQHGRLGGQRMDGNGLTIDLAESLGGRWSPTLTVSFGRASGDARPGDGRVDTFDPLYANLAYSTDAGYFYPGNNEDISVALSLQPVASLQVQAGAYSIRRIQSQDAAYQPPGLVLVPGNGTGGQHLATLPFLRATLQVDRYDETLVSLVRLVPRGVLEAARARMSTYALLQWTFRF